MVGSAEAAGREKFSCLLVFVLTLATTPVFGQAPLPRPPVPPENPSDVAAPPTFSPAELDRIVSPIALYPDPLVAQVLAAATYPEEIPDAARWADDHHYLSGEALTAAIAADRVPWNPSVQALLPFPSVLEMMANDMPWTRELGDAFLTNPAAVMNAVQRMRQKALDYGYLRSSPGLIVSDGAYVEILPANPSFIIVPYYDPTIVFAPPPPHLVVANAIYWGFGIRLGIWFSPWGWGTTRIGWATHTIVIDGAPWRRRWANRRSYVHPYGARRYSGPPPPERHRAKPRTPKERERERHKSGSERHRKKSDSVTHRVPQRMPLALRFAERCSSFGQTPLPDLPPSAARPRICWTPMGNVL